MINREIADQNGKRREERAIQEATRRGMNTIGLEWQTVSKTL